MFGKEKNNTLLKINIAFYTTMKKITMALKLENIS